MNYSVVVPDIDYWKKMISCQKACPVHTDSRGYVQAIANGEYERAYMIARSPNPLASICGRICGAPCEVSCRRKDLDKAVTIRALKRFVCEQFGSVNKKMYRNPIDSILNLIKKKNDLCEDIEDIKNYVSHSPTLTLSERALSVGIIGSGPAGLAAAHDLCLLGIKPVIYEMESVPAGMLYLGVPEYRLPKDVIRAEVAVIQSMGTEIICNTQVGKDISLGEIRKKHKATLIAVGAKKSRTIPIPNINAPGVIGGVDFLRSVALNQNTPIGERVIVVGGGNVAYDVARTLVRQTEYDISRTALRQKGVKEVVLVCLESVSEMPADDVEIKEGDEEGIIRYNSWGPKEILIDDKGHAKGISLIQCESVFDANNNFAPKFNPHKTLEIMGDKIFLSIGQSIDLSFIDSDEVTLNERGQLNVNGNNTEAEDVFVAGDIAYGPRLMIDAIASGKEAARRMFSYITGKKLSFSTSVHFEEIKNFSRTKGYENIKHGHPTTLPPSKRSESMDHEVENVFSHTPGVEQANRCLHCSVNTIFDSSKCVLCGGCIDVCPHDCLNLVSVNQLQGEEKFTKLLHSLFGNEDAPEGAAIIKDETICIRCGSCADRCPVHAITMEYFKFKEVLNES